MKQIISFLLLFMGTIAFAGLPDGVPVAGRSPSKTYFIGDSRNPNDPNRDNQISIAHREHPNDYYDIYTYPRFVGLYFSPDERYLVIDDRCGSGAVECVVLRQISKPPFFVKPRNIGEVCWELFWSLHGKPRRVKYDHQKTYFCEWLDTAHFVVGLQGDHFFPDPGTQKWGLDGGWHCVYDIVRNKAYTSEYTDSKNEKCEFEIMN